MSDKKYDYIGIIEVNGDSIHIARDNDKLYTGIVLNPGFCPLDEFEIDDSLSIDENIQRMVEAI